MDRPSVYIETSIVSYLAADPSRHPVTLRNQQLTRAWWTSHRPRYALYTSATVIEEAAVGDPRMAVLRGALLAPLAILLENEEARGLATALRKKIPFPARAEPDAAHVAIAAVYGMSYLLTWDCKHIANPRLIPRMARICEAWGREAPVPCTPAQLVGE